MALSTVIQLLVLRTWLMEHPAHHPGIIPPTQLHWALPTDTGMVPMVTIFLITPSRRCPTLGLWGVIHNNIQPIGAWTICPLP